MHSGIILWMCPANERWCYSVTPSLIGPAHTQKDARDFENAACETVAILSRPQCVDDK